MFLLFILCIEIRSASVHQNNGVTGINIYNKEISLLADDASFIFPRRIKKIIYSIILFTDLEQDQEIIV